MLLLGIIKIYRDRCYIDKTLLTDGGQLIISILNCKVVPFFYKKIETNVVTKNKNVYGLIN